jgi:hypothetical protein
MKLCLNEGLCIYICASLENTQVKKVLQQAFMACQAGYAADLPAKVQIWQHNDSCLWCAMQKVLESL